MENIGPGLGNILLMNNYFHDMATALLAASGIVLWLMLRRYGSSGQGPSDEEARAYFSRVYSGIQKLARFSLVWILAGGIPRTLFFRRFEWTNAVEHGQVPALILKHAMAFFFVGLGALLWMRCSRRMNALLGAPPEQP